jgi:hypothetical protein
MNLPRLVTLTSLIKNDLTSNEIPTTLGRLVKQVQAVINGPNEDNQRTAVAGFNELVGKLEASEVNRLSPAYKADLDELDVEGTVASDLVGDGLRVRVLQAIEPGYIHVQSLDNLKALVKEVNAFLEAVQQASSGLERLGIGPEELTPGDSIIGMTIPRREAKTFAALQDELDFLHQLLNTLTECIEGQVDEHAVATLRSSDFGIDVTATINVAAIFAMIIAHAKKALDKLRKYRDLKRQAEEINEPEIVEQFEEAGTKAMTKAIDEIQVQVMQRCKIGNKERAHEMENSITLKINGIVNRMEKGFTFEARTELPSNPTDEQKNAAEVVSALTKLDFKFIEGPRLLQLPEKSEDRDSAPSRPKRRVNKTS